MAQVLVWPVAIIGVLSLLALIRLALLALRHRVPLGLLLNIFFKGLPVVMLCRVKGEMEEWGLKIEMQEILDVYLRRQASGGRGFAGSEEDLRAEVIRARTGRGPAVQATEGSTT